MASPRIQAIIARLEKGRDKTRAALGALAPAQWNETVYAEPSPWTVRDLLAHFVSTEGKLLELCQDVAGGGKGTPEDFDLDGFNAEEQAHWQNCTPAQLLEALDAARQKTIDWARTLEDAQLDRVGNHPALGETTLEVLVLSIYGHQLFHMRDLKQ